MLDFHIKSEDKESKIEAKLLFEPPMTIDHTPVELPVAIEAIETDQEYFETQEAHAE